MGDVMFCAFDKGDQLLWSGLQPHQASTEELYMEQLRHTAPVAALQWSGADLLQGVPTMPGAASPEVLMDPPCTCCTDSYVLMSNKHVSAHQ